MQQAPRDKLMSETMPGLFRVLDLYKAEFSEKMNSRQTQMFAELQRRVRQVNFLLNGICHAEEQVSAAVFEDLGSAIAGSTAQPASVQWLDALQVYSEAFYWNAHKVAIVVSATEKNYGKCRLPRIPSDVRFGQIVLIRNWFMEHQWEINETFSLGGCSIGPVLNGGTSKNNKGAEMKDQGLYLNAIEWAEILTGLLESACKPLPCGK